MELLDKFNIKTNNMHIYDTAFSHSSYCNEHDSLEDYQRLEFLGDKVLDLIMSDYLYNKFDYEEGKMTKIRSMYVCENALYEYAKLLDFPTMPTTAESFPLLISLFPYTLNLYLVNAIMSLFKL